MSQRILVAFFTVLLICSFTSSAYASTGKPHKPHHKKVKKVKKPHHRHCR